MTESALCTKDIILERPPGLPLPVDALPESVRRFVNPEAPEKARTMAAKGVVPVKGDDLLIVLLQLASDRDENISNTAKASISGLPDAVLEAACASSTLPASFLDRLADLIDKLEHKEALAFNPNTPDSTIVRWAANCIETIAEAIALNESRVLRCPLIIEALYKNRNTRMSTVDRLIDLAVRNNIVLDNVATFAEHAEAISGQLIPEPDPGGEPLPQDVIFAEAIAADADDVDVREVIQADKVTEEEDVKESYKPLMMRVAKMSLHEKLRLAMVGNAGARALLVRDRSKQVSKAAISGPQVTAEEAAQYASSRQVSEEVLRYIGSRREWHANYELKRNLTFNPKTPLGISMRFLQHLLLNDLKELSRSKGVPSSLKQAAIQRIVKKDKAGGAD